MAQLIPEYARVIDSGDYTDPFQPSTSTSRHRPRQPRRRSRLDIIAPIENLLDRQIADAPGRLAFERTVEELA
jgi:hypothetical protein